MLECDAFVKAMRQHLSRQDELVKQLVGETSVEKLETVAKEYDDNSRQLRENVVQKHAPTLHVLDAARRGEDVVVALDKQVKVCDGKILSLINETRSALDSINVMQSKP